MRHRWCRGAWMIDRRAGRYGWQRPITVRAAIAFVALTAVGTACTAGSEQTANARTPSTKTAQPATVGRDALVARDGMGAGKIMVPGAEPEDGQWVRPA